MRSYGKSPDRGLADLPDHTVVVSPRARRARIRVTPREGVVVVIPRRFDRRRVPGLLREHAEWIERALARTAPHREHLASAAGRPLPGRIELPGIGIALDVEYRSGRGSSARASERGGRLVVSGPAGDPAACRAALRRWLARVAAEHLPDLLDAVAHDESLAYRAVTVRAQKTRWGSCTRAGSISLNRSLVFLPPEEVRYVMLHELLHVMRHDHSPAFWRLVRDRVPDADAHRRRLKDAWRAIPPWASESG
jgi:predicted metal-dependent hydrolase